MFTVVRWFVLLLSVVSISFAVLAKEAVSTPSAVAPTKVISDFFGNPVTVPSAVPDRDNFTFVRAKAVNGLLTLLVFVTDEGKRVYIEGYAVLDTGPTLILVMWREGEILRAAEDRNLRDLDSVGPAGVLVLVDPPALPPEERPSASPISASI